ncbi:MAG TPA: hypothetical protein VEU96_04025 [Bryobacteraceae bacterium]|nr:hypothetical protein [Bryobacteraceae bacterium]
MKKRTAKRRDRPMQPEYDFSKGVRGKYAERYRQGTNIVVLVPAVAEVFPDSKAVNDALMGLIRIAERQRATTTPSVRRVRAGRSS